MFKHETENNKWSEIADITSYRHSSACTVFEGKVVATGGNIAGGLNTVEAYDDHHENKWNSLPGMIEAMYNHSAVSMGNKLFVADGNNTDDCEVFNRISITFTVFNISLPHSVTVNRKTICWKLVICFFMEIYLIKTSVCV